MLLGHRVRLTGQGSQLRGDLDGPLHQTLRRYGFVDQIGADRLVHVEQPGPQHEVVGAVSAGMVHHLDRGDRERDADRQLNGPDPGRTVGHQSMVTGGGDDAATGDRRAVDRGDHRSPASEQRQERPVQRGDEGRDVVRTAFEDPFQICASREHSPVARDDDRRCEPGEIVHHGRQLIEHLDIELVDLAVLEPNDGDLIDMVHPDHAVTLGGSNLCHRFRDRPRKS